MGWPVMLVVNPAGGLGNPLNFGGCTAGIPSNSNAFHRALAWSGAEFAESAPFFESWFVGDWAWWLSVGAGVPNIASFGHAVGFYSRLAFSLEGQGVSAWLAFETLHEHHDNLSRAHILSLWPLR